MSSLTKSNNDLRISESATAAAAVTGTQLESVVPEISMSQSSRATSNHSTTISDKHEDDVIDVDLLEDILEERIHVRTCKGYALVLPKGKSPYTCYPFALHDTLILPWDFKMQSRMMILFSQSCTGQVAEGVNSCHSCQCLVKNQTLEGIRTRINEGVHKNSALTYHGFSGLQDLLHRKNKPIEFYRMQGLNQARKLLSKATALMDHKRLLMAIVSGKISRVDRLISIGLQQRKGIRGLLALYMAAAEGVYHPKSYTEEEDMKNVLLWRITGI